MQCSCGLPTRQVTALGRAVVFPVVSPWFDPPLCRTCRLAAGRLSRPRLTLPIKPRVGVGNRTGQADSRIPPLSAGCGAFLRPIFLLACFSYNLTLYHHFLRSYFLPLASADLDPVFILFDTNIALLFTGCQRGVKWPPPGTRAGPPKLSRSKKRRIVPFGPPTP